LTRGEVQLTDGLELLIQGGEELRPFPVEGWYDCGKTETLLETNRALLDQLANPVCREGVVVLPPVALDHAAEVSASVIGPHVPTRWPIRSPMPSWTRSWPRIRWAGWPARRS